MTLEGAFLSKVQYFDLDREEWKDNVTEPRTLTASDGIRLAIVTETLLVRCDSGSC